MAGRFPKGVYSRDTRDWYERSRYRAAIFIAPSAGVGIAAVLSNQDKTGKNVHVTGLYVAGAGNSFIQATAQTPTFVPQSGGAWPAVQQAESIWLGDPAPSVYLIPGEDNNAAITYNFYRFFGNFNTTLNAGDLLYEPNAPIVIIPPMRGWEILIEGPNDVLAVTVEFAIFPD